MPLTVNEDMLIDDDVFGGCVADGSGECEDKKLELAPGGRKFAKKGARPDDTIYSS